LFEFGNTYERASAFVTILMYVYVFSHLMLFIMLLN